MKHVILSILSSIVAGILLLVILTWGSPDEEDSATAAADPFTGQELTQTDQRPVAVVIDNADDSTTQWGVGSASVVLEAQTDEVSPSSLCLVYSSVDDMPKVGPVTLGHDIYWRILSVQGVLPVQKGCGRYTSNYLASYGIHAVDALEVGRNVFSCDDQTWSNSPMWYTNGDAVKKAAGQLGISTVVTDTDASSDDKNAAGDGLSPLLAQCEDGSSLFADESDAYKITIHFGSLSSTGFTYDAENGVYCMTHGSGTPQVDANTGKQVTFDNLLILYSAANLRDDGTTLDYDLSMGGGVWLYDGKLWDITWTQGQDSTFAFYDASGRTLKVANGRSYIALVSSVTGQELSVQSSDGKALR